MKKIFSVIVLAAMIFSSCTIFYVEVEAAHVAAYEEVTVINVSEYVNLRKEPSTNAEILARIPLGATVKVHAEYRTFNGFYSVIYQGIHGYIYKGYLDVPDWTR